MHSISFDFTKTKMNSERIHTTDIIYYTLDIRAFDFNALDITAFELITVNRVDNLLKLTFNKVLL